MTLSGPQCLVRVLETLFLPLIGIWICSAFFVFWSRRTAARCRRTFRSRVGAVGSFLLNKSRFEAYSDGVLAIAATLLVLEVHLPNFAGVPTDGEQTRALIGLWPQFLVHFTSFATIGMAILFPRHCR